MSMIENAEKDRKFCLHGMEHSLDVARIAYIIILENGLDIKKDVCYAAALLHDIGRGKEYKSRLSHHEQGAVIAAELLKECDFTAAETEEICDAIASHKKSSYDSGEDGLKNVLFSADKLSRNCFNCAMYEECYWSEDLKNKTIKY